ncbi:MAG: T9SS type A sorting domain-containing protein [Bacteroidetes bacterium]|nr:T9SS type A sorting domain-containing protein [Bacteroidota bacterium]
MADHSWRRFAFRVLDYLTPTSTVSIRFIAEDANAGSLIEAALDDITLWDETPLGVSEVNSLSILSVFPNPASSLVNIQVGLVRDQNVTIQIFDNVGREIYTLGKDLPAGNNIISVQDLNLANGLYQARVSVADESMIKKFSVIQQ